MGVVDPRLAGKTLAAHRLAEGADDCVRSRDGDREAEEGVGLWGGGGECGHLAPSRARGVVVDPRLPSINVAAHRLAVGADDRVRARDGDRGAEVEAVRGRSGERGHLAPGLRPLSPRVCGMKWSRKWTNA